MAVETIEINNNPVTAWETFHEELPRERFKVSQKKIRKMGWFYMARYQLLKPSKKEALRWLNNGLGRDVKLWNEKSLSDFEGMLTTIRLSNGRGEAVATMGSLANQCWTRYKDLTTGNNVRSAVASDSNSQDRFGIKEVALNGGQMTSDNADTYAENYLGMNYWARPDLSRVDQLASVREDLLLEFTVSGYWLTLGWQVYNQTAAAGTDTASAIVAAAIAASGQFIASTSIDTNAMLHTKEFDADRTPLDIISSIADVGDANFVPWVAGVREDRELFFERSAPSFVGAS